MPLLQAVLTDEILKLTDSKRPDFVGFPNVAAPDGSIDLVATSEKVAANWANAAVVYFSTITNPVVLPSSFELARTAFEEAMAPTLLPFGSPTGILAITNGFVAFAARLSLPDSVLLPPPALQLATPPPAPFILPPLPPIADPAVPAGVIAGITDAWARTGLAAVGTVATPPATLLPWS